MAAATVAAAVAGFVALAALAARPGSFGWDAHLSLSLYRLKEGHGILNGHTDLLVWILEPAAEVAEVAALIVILLVLTRRRRLRDGAFILAAIAGTLVLEPILKDLIKRPPFRPGDSGYSFPSGHAMRSAAALSALVITAWPSRWRWPAFVASILLCGVIGVAIVYNGWHWVSDVVAGWCVGLGWVGILCLALRSSEGRGTTDAE